jgi:hypothetical protein
VWTNNYIPKLEPFSIRDGYNFPQSTKLNTENTVFPSSIGVGSHYTLLVKLTSLSTEETFGGPTANLHLSLVQVSGKKINENSGK